MEERVTQLGTCLMQRDAVLASNAGLYDARHHVEAEFRGP
jgi:hypothetical protein